jgi:hypothetical protein
VSRAHIPDLLDPRLRSLIRGNVLVIVSLAAATLLSKAPHLRATHLLILPLVACIVGTAETARCMQRRWSWYHGGVLLCLYMDVMSLTMIAFFWLYPYLA